jgi:hypothetical protein
VGLEGLGKLKNPFVYWREVEGTRGSVVVKALLYYKPEGRRFDTRRGDFFIFT